MTPARWRESVAERNNVMIQLLVSCEGFKRILRITGGGKARSAVWREKFSTPSRPLNHITTLRTSKCFQRDGRKATPATLY